MTWSYSRYEDLYFHKIKNVENWKLKTDAKKYAGRINHWLSVVSVVCCTCKYLSSRWELPCTEHPACSSPGSTLSASASSAVWIISGWCGLRTQWSSETLSHHSPRSSLKILYKHIVTHFNVLRKLSRRQSVLKR